METRKVYEYRDGRLIRTDRVSDDNVSLSWEPVPPQDKIARQQEFEVVPLTSQEFDAAWVRATDAWA